MQCNTLHIYGHRYDEIPSSLEIISMYIPYSRLFWRALKLAIKMLLANFNLANTCASRAYARELACLAELILAI